MLEERGGVVQSAAVECEGLEGGELGGGECCEGVDGVVVEGVLGEIEARELGEGMAFEHRAQGVAGHTVGGEAEGLEGVGVGAGGECGEAIGGTRPGRSGRG